jgi:hypothetical protein
MASGMYAAGKVALWKGLDLTSASLKVALIDTGTYSVDLAAHDNYNDLSGVVGTPVALGTPTVTPSTTFAVLDADDTLFTGVSGASIETAVIYLDTGNPATSTLLFYIDGLSVTPDGGNILCQWNGSGIAKY